MVDPLVYATCQYRRYRVVELELGRRTKGVNCQASVRKNGLSTYLTPPLASCVVRVSG